MSELPLIPTPPSQWWREFRIQVLPALVFGGAVVGAALLWRTTVAAPTLVGEVEMVQAQVTSPQAGALAQLTVDRLQPVSKDDPVAIVITTDPKIIEASLAVVRAEVELLKMNTEPGLDRQRALVDVNRLHLDVLGVRVNLARDRAMLFQAENEYRRIEQLRGETISEGEFDIAKANRDALVAQVAAQDQILAELQPELDQLRLGPASQTNRDPIHAEIAVQEAKLRQTEAQMKPIVLTAPMTGVVSMVHRLAGENIIAGEPILTISAVQPDRIVGFLSQPFVVEPTVGMSVEVRSRSLKRQMAMSQIVRVGANLELMNPALQRSSAMMEKGLPVFVNLPPGLGLRAGELVDLIIRQ